jgi:hypothetical protein
LSAMFFIYWEVSRLCSESIGAGRREMMKVCSFAMQKGYTRAGAMYDVQAKARI